MCLSTNCYWISDQKENLLLKKHCIPPISIFQSRHITCKWRSENCSKSLFVENTQYLATKWKTKISPRMLKNNIKWKAKHMRIMGWKNTLRHWEDSKIDSLVGGWTSILRGCDHLWRYWGGSGPAAWENTMVSTRNTIKHSVSYVLCVTIGEVGHGYTIQVYSSTP